MVINLKFKNLLTVAILTVVVSVNSFAAQNVPQAPEVQNLPIEGEFHVIESATPELKKAFIDPTPEDKKDGIPVGELGADGGNKDMILKLAREMAEGKHDLYDSMLISYKGKLVFESYYSRGRINLPHFQRSATKSYTAMAIGRAMQLGYLTMADLNKPVVSFLKDSNAEKFVDGAENITLEQVMSMRSGLRISGNKITEIINTPGLNQAQALLEQSIAITPVSHTFSYQAIDANIAMHVLDAIVPGSAKDFIKNEVLGKMGITVYGWATDVNGLPHGYGGDGSNQRSRDMLKWGTLIMNKGKLNGKQFIPAAFIAKATSRVAEPNVNWVPDDAEVSGLSYGYFMWRADMKVGDKLYDNKFVWGGGGQYVMTIEELDLVIVFTAHGRDDITLALVPKRVLPAFVLFSVSSIAHDTIQHAIDNPARPETDRKLDALRKPAELLKFVGTSEGDVVLEMLSADGYYAEILSKAVGSKGKVDAHNNADYKAYLKDKLVKRLAVDGRMENVTELVAEVNEMELEAGKYDSIYLVQRFHDFWDVADGGTKFDVERTLAQFHKALKVDGTIAIVDHAAADGAPLSVGHTLHRIAKDAVITELAKGGFVLEAEADFLANTEDDGSEVSRGTTSRMVLKFKKK